MSRQAKALLRRHESLNHLEDAQVESHVQRATDDWILNTLMLKGYDVPFKYQRKKRYRSLEGARVNLTYYAQTEAVGGLEFETMRVVRLRRA
ncbi:MAG: hypothetical protein AAGI15_09020 [Pseudomonadota bacterium]